MRRSPHQGVRHSPIDHGEAYDGVLLLHLWVLPSIKAILLANDPPPLLFLACGWHLRRMALSSTNGGASTNLGLKDLHVQEKGVPNRPRSGPRRPDQDDRPKPIPTRFSRPFAPMGPHVFMYFAPHLHHFDDVILTSKMEVLLSWSLVFYTLILGDVTLWHFGPCHLWEWFFQALKHERES
jgi:hypothetical protein